tara:strand:- start:512 stop:844 length:333 start_codon:yes stop_codon:yes gene_type:complete
MSKQQDVLKFLGSPRGQYIVGQALAIAVKELEKEKEPLREVSNIEDMKFLGEELFKAGYATHTMLSNELLQQIKSDLGNDPDKIIEDTELLEQINKEIQEKQNQNGQAKK